ncbi:MAG: radical SAM protein [Magnetococcus sp. YQC-5]
MNKLFLDGSKLFHHLDEVVKWQQKKPFPPIHVEVSPTSACNHRCQFCYADHGGHEKNFIPDNTLLTLMEDMGTMGVKSCLFAGDGEPLLHKKCIEAVRVGRAAGVDMALNSNGVPFTETMARQVLPHLTWMRFSIMSSDPAQYALIHGTRPEDLERAFTNIERAVRIKHEEKWSVTLGIQQVLLPENGNTVAELAKRAREIGVDYYVLKPFSQHPANRYQGGDPLSLVERFAEQVESIQALSTDSFTAIFRRATFSDNGERDYDRCLGLPFIGQIAGDGKVYACCPFFGDARFCYGDLRTTRFPEIWYGQQARETQQWIARDWDVRTNCMSYCRHHQINKLLWKQTHPPDHINFI